MGLLYQFLASVAKLYPHQPEDPQTHRARVWAGRTFCCILLSTNFTTIDKAKSNLCRHYGKTSRVSNHIAAVGGGLVADAAKYAAALLRQDVSILDTTILISRI
jgi:hypothetical protein